MPILVRTSVPSLTVFSKPSYSPYSCSMSVPAFWYSSCGGRLSFSATLRSRVSAFLSFFQDFIFSILSLLVTRLRDRSMCAFSVSTRRTLRTVFCPSRTKSRMFLIHEEDISETCSSPFLLYSSSFA